MDLAFWEPAPVFHDLIATTKIVTEFVRLCITNMSESKSQVPFLDISGLHGMHERVFTSVQKPHRVLVSQRNCHCQDMCAKTKRVHSKCISSLKRQRIMSEMIG